MVPLYKEDLDKYPAGRCACGCEKTDGVFFHSRCHIKADMQVRYQDGVLKLYCGECEAPVGEIAVASKPCQKCELN